MLEYIGYDQGPVPQSAQLSLVASVEKVTAYRASRSNAKPEPMEYKGVEYSVVQLADDAGWRWEVRFADGKSKSGVTEISRAAAIKLAEYEIDRVLKHNK